MAKLAVKKTEFNYNELCDFFHEEKKEGRNKTLQFKRWRKAYSIERIGNSYKYKMTPLSTDKKTENLTKGKRLSNFDYIESLIFEKLSQSENNVWDSTAYERQQELGLVNSNYQLVVSEEQYEIFAQEHDLSEIDLKNYCLALYEINRDTIRKVRNSMERKQYMAYEKTFKVIYATNRHDIENKPVILTGKDMNDVMLYRNALSREMTNGECSTFYMVKNKGIKKKIIEAVNEHFGFSYHCDAERWWLDNVAIRNTYKNILIDELSKKDKLLITNDIQQKRLINSKRKSLNDINKFDKRKTTRLLVDITDEIDLYV
jgi:hypothetical protein